MAAAAHIHVRSANAARQQIFGIGAGRQQGLAVIPTEGKDDAGVVLVAHDGVGGDGNAVVGVRGADRDSRFCR